MCGSPKYKNSTKISKFYIKGSIHYNETSGGISIILPLPQVCRMGNILWKSAIGERKWGASSRIGASRILYFVDYKQKTISTQQNCIFVEQTIF